ncbi:MAG: OmpA family protein, partial [Hyphomicrobiaceae bacterium]
RAISVVRYLVSRGVPPKRLVAAGYGEFQPLEEGATDDVLRRNRRIELKLTNR